MELVNILDKKYSGKNAVACANEGKEVTLPQSGVKSTVHGKLTVHGSGAYLVCGMCGTAVPTGKI